MDKLPKRKQLRLKGYDYSQNGHYFVAICTENKGSVFGIIQDNEVILNDVGVMVGRWWLELGNKYPVIKLWEYIVMPNHIHGIIEICTHTNVGADLRVCPQEKSSKIPSTGGHTGPPLPIIVQWFNAFLGIPRSGNSPQLAA